MADRLTSLLQKVYRQKVVTPVIVKVKHNFFENARAMLRDLVPVSLLQAQFGSFLPRVGGLVEFPLSKWKEIPTFDMIATVLTPNIIEEVVQWREVETIYPDFLKWALQTVPPDGMFEDKKGIPFSSTFWTKKLVGANKANEQGFKGEGITVAVIDTGARVSHQQLRRVKMLTAMPEKGGSGADSNGHGSHCVSTVGGAYAIDRKYNIPCEGMAPDCNLVSIQALGFIIGIGFSSDIIQAMEMCIKLDAGVVSMSLGSEDPPPDLENPEAEVINKLTEDGRIIVVAAGNSGPSSGTIGSPGSCANALTVGAWDEIEGSLAEFSSRGPVHGLVKPDVVAPGVRIDSALVGYLDGMVDKTQIKFGAISGTSMACPHVSGLVALMKEKAKKEAGIVLTVSHVKDMMEKYGEEKTNYTGYGLITWDLFERYFEEELKARV